mmetsp:Transcript_12779/g.42693  ORF Transcript_12779/g.42693 Transcript_12779/m.42693 type:complete len:271 (+) Transcript_12779:692-1504(+)
MVATRKKADLKYIKPQQASGRQAASASRRLVTTSYSLSDSYTSPSLSLAESGPLASSDARCFLDSASRDNRRADAGRSADLGLCAVGPAFAPLPRAFAAGGAASERPSALAVSRGFSGPSQFVAKCADDRKVRQQRTVSFFKIQPGGAGTAKPSFRAGLSLLAAAKMRCASVAGPAATSSPSSPPRNESDAPSSRSARTAASYSARARAAAFVDALRDGVQNVHEGRFCAACLYVASTSAKSVNLSLASRLRKRFSERATSLRRGRRVET